MTVLGVSSGNGVMLYPFKSMVLGNIELRSDYTHRGVPYQYQLNFPNTFFLKQLPDIKEMFILPDIIIGHPKCGNSSRLALSRGKAFKSHKDEPSLDLFIASIIKFSPSVFLLENLPKLLETYSEEDFKEIFSEYSLTFWVGSMEELGNSQKNRVRLIITGVHRKKLPLKQRLQLNRRLKVKFKTNEPKNTGDVLRDLPKDGNFRPALETKLAFYGGRQETYSSIQALWNSLPEESKRFPTPLENFSTAPGVYRDRLSESPATIRKSNRCFNPDGFTYTPRERARIQGIPDDFKIYESGDRTSDFNKGCVTTGSTPSYEVGLWFYMCLQGAKIITSQQ